MSFVVEDFHQLVALLEQHPEWRAELRRLVPSEQLLSLPDLVRELTEAQSPRHSGDRRKSLPNIAKQQRRASSVLRMPSPNSPRHKDAPKRSLLG
ncbi:MAG: hypothetical protein C4335_05845 [Armatimonadota bacterium]